MQPSASSNLYQSRSSRHITLPHYVQIVQPNASCVSLGAAGTFTASLCSDGATQCMLGIDPAVPTATAPCCCAIQSVRSYLVIHETSCLKASQVSNLEQVPGIQMLADMLSVLSMACCTGSGWVGCSNLRTMDEVVHTKWQKVL